MSIIDDAKKKVEEVTDDLKNKANDLENKAHEEKGKLEGRIDHAKEEAEKGK